MKYLIKKENNIIHGTLGWSHNGNDDQYCEAGETVKIKWQPTAGWGLQEVHYTDAGGNIVPITGGEFVMPDSAIFIGATFKRFVIEDWTDDGAIEGNLASIGAHGTVVDSGIPVSDLATKAEISEINPFKGWFANTTDLNTAYPTPSVGDYAYVKGAESTDPAAIYECTTAGTWNDSGRTADTSNVQTLASGQEVNEVHIVNDLTTGGINDVLSAEQGKNIGVVLYGGISFVNIDMSGEQEGKYFPTNNTTIGYATASQNYYGCINISCSAGDVFKVFGIGGNSYGYLWNFVDASRNILSHADAKLKAVNGVEITAPSNTVALYCNFHIPFYEEGDLEYTPNIKKAAITEKGLIEIINSIRQNAQPLSGKKIVVFGDSISDFTDANGKRWSDYAEELTGAEFVNVAVGGSQLRERCTYQYLVGNTNNTPNNFITLFNPTKTYLEGDRVFYKPSSTMNCYTCNNGGHSGAWNADDFTEVSYNYYIYSPLDMINMVFSSCQDGADRFENQIAAAECIKDHLNDDNTEIISRLSSIDWDSVDLVIVEGGANDYKDLVYGSQDSESPNKSYGAVNFIVKTFCTKYKNIPLYYLSPVVHWTDYNSSNPDPSKWSDVYIPTGGTITLKEFTENLIVTFARNHITTKDMYSNLGWNMYNFSNFFNSGDGSHPLKGFPQYAQAVVSFICSNKNFI